MNLTTDPGSPGQQQALVDDLYGRTGSGAGRSGAFTRRLRFWWAKYEWWMGVQATKGMKRTLDILMAGALLIALFPLFLVVAVWIKLTDGGPVLFWHTRVGRWGSQFAFPKFRSMKINAEQMKDALLSQNQHEEGITFKIRRDPRVTWIGRVIRKLSIDELPQLWCVLKGEMSLVGPRPPVPEEVAEYTLADRRRLAVTPGLTCIWQISGRAEIPFPRQVELDVEYIENQSFWLDIKILLKTIPAVLLCKGAY